MAKKSLVPVKDLLSGFGGRSADAEARLRCLMDLSAFGHAFLGEPLNRHCVLANIHTDTLIMIADSAVWSARAHFECAGLLVAIEQRFSLGLRHVRIKTRPQWNAYPLPAARRARLSAATSLLLRTMAADIRHDYLRTALLRLASRSKGS